MNGNENHVNGPFIGLPGGFIGFWCPDPLHQKWSAGIVHPFIPLP
jgi:hypothetical protein